MPMQLGRLLTIARHKTGTPDVEEPNAPADFDFICGAQSRSFDMSAERIDRTTAPCGNPGGPVVAASTSGRQNRSFQLSGIQITNTQGLGLLEDARQAREWPYLISVPGWGDFYGIYAVSVSLAGEVEGDMTYNATFTLADASTELFEVEA